MRVKCLDVSLTSEQKLFLGVPESVRTRHQITVGATYTVLGLSFVIGSHFFGSGPVLEILDDASPCISLVPLCLFEIVDPRPSRFWVARKVNDFTLSLWPEEFYEDYFHDRLSDGEPIGVEAFRRVVDRLENEFVVNNNQV